MLKQHIKGIKGKCEILQHSTLKLAVTPNPYFDPAFLEQIVKAIIARIVEVSGSAPKPERVVTLMHQVKGMRDMGYVTFSGEEDAKVVGHWLRKVKKVITKMRVPEESRVDCATQLLSESANS